MKHKTETLAGALLDAAVALADGRLVTADEPNWPKGDYKRMREEFGGRHVVRWYGSRGELGGLEPMDNQGSPSTDWSVGGPIIERAGISVMRDAGDDFWCATTKFFFEGGIDGPMGAGPTPLIAAMRCFVASKLGHEVDLP